MVGNIFGDSRLKNLKKISYTNLKKLVFAIKKFDDELSELDSHGIQLWDNPKIITLEDSIVNYLDDVVGEEEVSYFIYETNYGRGRDKDNNPYTIELDGKEYKISDFDSWYEYLLAVEKTE